MALHDSAGARRKAVQSDASSARADQADAPGNKNTVGRADKPVRADGEHVSKRKARTEWRLLSEAATLRKKGRIDGKNSNKWDKIFWREYQPWKPMVPCGYRELDLFLRFAEQHHEKCKIEHFPEALKDLYEAQTRGQTQQRWTSSCEAAYRTVECHLFLHQVFDAWPEMVGPIYVSGGYPEDFRDFKAWFARLQASGATCRVEGWPMDFYPLIDFLREGQTCWTEQNVRMFECLNRQTRLFLPNNTCKVGFRAGSEDSDHDENSLEEEEEPATPSDNDEEPMSPE